MINIIESIVITGSLFIIFCAFLVYGLIRKKRKAIYISIVALIVTFISGIWSVYLFTSKAYKKVSAINIDNPFKPRTGLEIYTALFGKPVENCIIVTNNYDQLVPRLDCCIWLEFKTCPNEIRRISALEPYERNDFPANDSDSYVPTYSPRPEWFKPHILGDSIIVLQKYNTENPNRDQILIFSKDSTHAFYCDMAD